MNDQTHKTLEGRVAVVTGASSGIGAATAIALADRGARVALLARRKAKLDELAAAIRDRRGHAEAWEIDVTDRDAVEEVAKAIAERLGRADLVINNAGVMLPHPIEDRRADEWKQQIDLNIGGVMNVIGAFTPALLAAASAGGRADLVNVSSIGARNVFTNFAVYCATKAFVTHLSVQLRTELGPKGVRVSAIEPGIVGTELPNHIDFAPAKQWLDSAKAQMEFLEASDVAEAIAFTVSAPKRVNVQQLTIMPTAQST
jgi:NADP-dependent 3-hydroxy acid dehydrogenase YdfG